MTRRSFLALAPAVACARDFAQWGGPHRDFHTPPLPVKPSFSVLWKRELGEGVSGVAIEGSTAYTLYRSGSNEVVIAVDALTGKTRWEFAYPTAFKADNPSAGHGPRAMPQVFGDSVISAGAAARLYSLNKTTGRPVWSHDLYAGFKATEMGYGYSSHPLVYGNKLILMSAGLLALDLATGKLLWQTQRFKNSNSSPILIESQGQHQVIAHTATHLISADPETGELLWSLRNSTAFGQPILTPLWGPDGLLFISTAYDGSQAVAVSGRSARILWMNERLRVYYSSAVRMGDTVYASNGQAGILVALSMLTGRVLWQQRGFPHAHILAVGDCLLLSTLEGRIDFARPQATGLDILASARLLDPPSRTPPTVAGNRLFLRDNRHLLLVH